MLMPQHRSFRRAVLGTAIATLILLAILGGLVIGASKLHNATVDGVLGIAFVFFIGGAIYVEVAAAVRAVRTKMKENAAVAFSIANSDQAVDDPERPE